MPFIDKPYIPQNITVHLGPPDFEAEDVTVTFPEYVKNVASSEVYPTWEPAALQANIWAIISFALNRVYTEFYPSRGYPFQITASTAFDQKFIKGRNIFENVSRMVDRSFNQYLRRSGFVEPLAAKFCNGTTVTCDGLSQWGSQSLAQKGLGPMDILRRYYGDNIELVTDAPVMSGQASYPGSPLRRGSRGKSVTQMQVMLNRISKDYPAIPRIQPVDGIFGSNTERSVKRFQEIFNLTPDGIVGNATWYKAVYLYVGITDLAELVSEGQPFPPIYATPQKPLAEGDRGETVRTVQSLLDLISEFYSNIPPLAQDGIFGPNTRDSVIALQHMAGISETGMVDQATWDAIYRVYAGISDTVSQYSVLIPEEFRPPLNTNPTQYPGQSLELGDRDQKGGES